MYINTLPFDPAVASVAGTADGTENIGWTGQKCWLSDGSRWNNYGGSIMLLVVRNSAGIALEPKRMVTFKTGKFGLEVDGYNDVDMENAFAIWDGHTANITDKHHCYIVLGGPTLIKSNLAGDSTNVINEGDWVIAATAVTSQSTTAGRIQVFNIANTTTENDRNILLNALRGVGFALSAKTTSNTNADTLVYCCKRW